MTHYNPDIHHRRSIRLKNYDYSQSGAYFITICAQNKRCVFGTIQHREMVLSAFGNIIDEQWRALPDRFPNIILHEHVVMPNHVHGIIQIAVGATLAVAPLAVAPLAVAQNTTPSDRTSTNRAAANRTSTNRAAANWAPARGAPTIGDIVGAYKSLCVKHCLDYIKKHHPDMILGKLWQRNYYEHIIRNEQSYLEIAEYIVNNPIKWAEDKLYVETSSSFL